MSDTPEKECDPRRRAALRDALDDAAAGTEWDDICSHCASKDMLAVAVAYCKITGISRASFLKGVASVFDRSATAAQLDAMPSTEVH